jgi:glycosyltransferase involved in cell wall biosynthesis
LAAEPDLEIEVLYAMIPDAAQQGDGFGVAFTWDVPILEGYPWRRLRNVAREPSVTRFGGCDTPELYSEIRQDRWDAVLVNGWVAKTCVQALAAARRAGVPCIVRGEANSLRHRALWKRVLHRALLRQYAAFLYIGRANRAFYRAHGIGEKRLFFGPYGVDNEEFARAAREPARQRDSLRSRWGIAPDACCLLFAGKLEPKKRPLDLVEAAARLRSCTPEQPPAVHVLFAGDGALRAACEDASRRWGVPVTFAGFLNQSEMPAAYAAADALVLPSDAGETWGLVVNEAMACGLPAVVSDRVGCQEDLVDASTGWVYRCGDVTALTAALREAVRDPGALTAKGAAARARVASYSVEALVQGTVDAVRFAVDHGGSRPKRARRMPA